MSRSKEYSGLGLDMLGRELGDCFIPKGILFDGLCNLYTFNLMLVDNKGLHSWLVTLHVT